MTAGVTPPRPLRAFAAVTAAYWAFMLSDGALRMLVLLHFHDLGFSPLQLAWLFVLYEVAGIVTNLCAGWIAARFGLAVTLYAGLSLQIVALAALAQLDPAWAISVSVVYVMVVQGLSGVAKDLSKMASKSAVKALAPAGQGALFTWVAVLTGSKNAVKGAGFLIGAALLGIWGFVPVVWGMATVLAVILSSVWWFMPAGLPGGVKGTKFTALFATDSRVNQLSLARMFLFGARDVWFVVGIPIYFQAALGGTSGAFFLIGGFMALWTIGYGVVQASAPRLLRASTLPLTQVIALARWWGGALVPIPFGLALAAGLSDGPAEWLTVVLVAGLLLFGGVFAVNSALHSYLILAFAGAGRVTMDVGFYYMANAAGRLIGTVLSGLSYQWGGLPLCLATAGGMALASWLAAARLERANNAATPL